MLRVLPYDYVVAWLGLVRRGARVLVRQLRAASLLELPDERELG